MIVNDQFRSLKSGFKNTSIVGGFKKNLINMLVECCPKANMISDVFVHHPNLINFKVIA